MNDSRDKPTTNEALVNRMDLAMPRFQHVVEYILVELQREDR